MSGLHQAPSHDLLSALVYASTGAEGSAVVTSRDVGSTKNIVEVCTLTHTDNVGSLRRVSSDFGMSSNRALSIRSNSRSRAGASAGPRSVSVMSSSCAGRVGSPV